MVGRGTHRGVCAGRCAQGGMQWEKFALEDELSEGVCTRGCMCVCGGGGIHRDGCMGEVCIGGAYTRGCAWQWGCTGLRAVGTLHGAACIGMYVQGWGDGRGHAVRDGAREGEHHGEGSQGCVHQKDMHKGDMPPGLQCAWNGECSKMGHAEEAMHNGCSVCRGVCMRGAAFGGWLTHAGGCCPGEGHADGCLIL